MGFRDPLVVGLSALGSPSGPFRSLAAGLVGLSDTVRLRVTVSAWFREPYEVLCGFVVFRSPVWGSLWGSVQLAARSSEALWG